MTSENSINDIKTDMNDTASIFEAIDQTNAVVVWFTTNCCMFLKYIEGKSIKKNEPVHCLKRTKEWEFLKVKGRPVKEYLRKDTCKEQIKLYRDGLKSRLLQSLEVTVLRMPTGCSLPLSVAEEVFINTTSDLPASSKCSPDCSIM